MKALLLIDVQNEFSYQGKRPVPNYLHVRDVIMKKVDEARKQNHIIAWVRHFSKPNESLAFVPDTWGSEFVEGLSPLRNALNEKEFHKYVYGAFTGTDVGSWFQTHHIKEVLIVGFYTHGCVSTTAREAIMAEYDVFIDVDATGTCALYHELLGSLTAEEVHRSALIQIANMGATLIKSS